MVGIYTAGGTCQREEDQHLEQVIASTSDYDGKKKDHHVEQIIALTSNNQKVQLVAEVGCKSQMRSRRRSGESLYKVQIAGG